MYSDVIVQSTVYVIYVLLKGCNVVHLFYHSDLTSMLNELQYVMLLYSVKIKLMKNSCICIPHRG
jgi:hypothetical protein